MTPDVYISSCAASLKWDGAGCVLAGRNVLPSVLHCYSDSEKKDECLLRTLASSRLHHANVVTVLCLDRVMLVNDSASKRIRRELDPQS